MMFTRQSRLEFCLGCFCFGGQMGMNGWKKMIVVGVLLAFTAAAAAWTTESAVPSFQEKEGTPIVKKHKKFPWLPVILGVGAGVVLVVLLTRKKQQTLDVTLGFGAVGTPAASAHWKKGTVVRYDYAPKAGFDRLQVRLDGTLVPSSGTVIMDDYHSLDISTSERFTLTVRLGAGTSGTPAATASYGRDQVVHYSYSPQAGSGSLQVRLDNIVVAASGTVTMSTNRTLTAGITDSVATYSHGVLIVDGIRYELALIPAGEFLMGSNTPEASRYEQPVHTVLISRPFWFGKTEVTQELFQAVMGYNPAKFKNGGNFPVEHAYWDEFQGFIQSLNQMLGGNAFRWPTEAEWEYACRAGTTGERYGESDAIAWYAGNSGGQTHPVAMKQPNAFGLYDMLGNVWEWTRDIWRDYSPEYQVDPTYSGSGTGYIYRGGGWDTTIVRSAMRDRNHFSDSSLDTMVSVGFRLARTDE
jgi:formylglycine-generating enzyme required for sulfatase activity